MLISQLSREVSLASFYLIKFTKVYVIYPTENNPLSLLSSPLLFILSKSNGSQSFKRHHENENSHLPIPFSFFFQNPTNHWLSQFSLKKMPHLTLHSELHERRHNLKFIAIFFSSISSYHEQYYCFSFPDFFFIKKERKKVTGAILHDRGHSNSFTPAKPKINIIVL